MQKTSRWTIAVSVTAATMLLATGIAGLVSAADEAPLTTLSLPEPRVGDEARYEYIQTEGGLEEPTIVDGPRDGFGFAWRSPRVAFDLNGAPHMTNSFYEISYGWQDTYDENYRPTGEQEWGQYADWTYDIDVVDGQVVSSWMATDEQEQDIGDGQVMVYSQGSTHFNEHYGTEASVPYRYPCFTFNAFQGAPVEVLGPMQIHDDCSWLRKEANMGDGAFSTYTPLSIETFEGLETVHFVKDAPFREATQREHGGASPATGATHVWLSEDYPYPVKIAHPLDADGDRYDVYVLTEFFRGEDSLVTAADAVDGADPLLLDKAPLGPAGPDASSFTDGFTVAQAYAAALEDPELGLQAFLDEHPDAYMGRIFHDMAEREDRGGDDFEYTFYRFHVTAGGTTTLAFEVRQEVRNGHDEMGRDEEPVTTVTVEGVDPDQDRFPDPAIIPGEYPTVASTADLWRRLGGHDRVENTLEFVIWCGDDACDHPSHMLLVGHTQDWARAAFTPDTVQAAFGAQAEEADSLKETDTIQVREFQGRMDIGTSNYRVETRPAESEQGLQPEKSAPVLTQTAVRADRVWTFPSAATVAGIGAGSLLFGSVIAGWPALKGGLLAPLFSRVHRTEALDHPLRRRMMDLINTTPGIHLQAIADGVGAPRSTVLHHLYTLEKMDMVLAEHAGHYTCYFSKDRAARLSIKAAPVVKAEGARALVDVIQAEPGLSVKQAAAAAGLSLSTTYYHVRRLRGAGLVAVDGGTLAITATGRATLADLLH